MAPAKLKEKSFKQLTEVLKKHYEPTRIVIAEQFYFHRRSQQPGESIAQYVVELRRLATYCEFTGYLEKALRDRFVCGIRNEGIQRSLLTEKNLTLARAIELAQGMEMAEKNVQSFKGTEAPIQKIRQSVTPLAGNPQQFQISLAIDVVRRITQQQIIVLKRLFVIFAKRRVMWQKFVVKDWHNNHLTRSK